MTQWLAIGSVLGLLAVTLAGVVWFSSTNKRPRRKQYPVPEQGWSNTAIRKQGKAGKGIR
ncbi:MAG TPA: hypothetical protein PK878_10105 [bacterium]|nr:hypothetical protein [Candidatus Omnitrophota bacterium]HOJ60627.1 hypothetical protein [bacterium]HOL93143.1 hypothetical protein [bacterium]HPP01723.1 hypothetical protein [bacterium]HXK93747.1 hypothetical protein [bacterium]